MSGFSPSEAVPLAPRTSTGVGGPAEHFATVRYAEGVEVALDWARDRGLTVTLLGGGSNVVVADAGVSGLVLDVALEGVSAHRLAQDQLELRCGAGAPWDDCVARAVALGAAGLECLSGIPGRVGATPIQNVGAYGQDVSQTLSEVQVFDREARRELALSRRDCRFGYRTSRFKREEPQRFVVLGATFRLALGAPPQLDYPELRRSLADLDQPTLEQVRRRVLEIRRAKSMLLDPSDENSRSCGSFFVNPELSPERLDALRGRSAEAPPCFETAAGLFKVPAAWLIERAGFRRGQRFGHVGISSRHCLALTCHDGASAAELAALARRVRDGVERSFGVRLEPEPRFLGFELDDGGLPRP